MTLQKRCLTTLQVSEELVRGLFSQCGDVVDSRMCGDPNSALRFAFIEFDGEDAVTKARCAALWRQFVALTALVEFRRFRSLAL